MPAMATIMATSSTEWSNSSWYRLEIPPVRDSLTGNITQATLGLWARLVIQVYSTVLDCCLFGKRCCWSDQCNFFQSHYVKLYINFLLHTHMHALTHTHTHTCKYTHTHTHAHTHTHIRTHTHIHRNRTRWWVNMGWRIWRWVPPNLETW